MNGKHIISSFVIIAALSACDSDDYGGPIPDIIVIPDDVELFDPDTVLNVSVQFDDADWDLIRHEGREISVLANQCDDFVDYTFVPADITVDGETINDVRIRKKGSLGSLSTVRPSLKVNFEMGVGNEDRKFKGQRRLTLNNNQQDPSDIEQCLGYSVFEAAGIPTPRCNFARVNAQGNDRGIYTHIESIKRPFLLRVFGNNTGNLYEGQGADFNAGLVDRFQLKTNEELNDRSDLDRVVQALAVSDAQLWNSLDQVVDMDQFLTFIATEALIGHSDSYSGLQNNFFIYHNPTDDRFHFIPWGADQTFQSALIGGGIANDSIYLAGQINARIWQVPELRNRYDDRMRELLNTVWDEATLIAEADRMANLINADQAEVDIVKDFINNRRAAIEEELGTDRGWTGPPNQGGGPPCIELPDVTATFDMGWNTGIGTFSLAFVLDNNNVVINSGAGSSAWAAYAFNEPEKTSLSLEGTEPGSGRDFLFVVNMPNEVYAPGTIPMHGFETLGFVFETTPPLFQFYAFLGDGDIILNTAPRVDGASVNGSWDFKLIKFF